VTKIAFSPDGATLGWSSQDGMVRLWDFKGDTAPRTLEGHGASVEAMAFSRDGRFVASGSQDGSVRLWNRDGRHLLTIRAVRLLPTAYALSADGYFQPFGEDARQLPICRVGALTFPFDLCEERTTVADLVARVVAGDASYESP